MADLSYSPMSTYEIRLISLGLNGYAILINICIRIQNHGAYLGCRDYELPLFAEN